MIFYFKLQEEPIVIHIEYTSIESESQENAEKQPF
jgi:hypothetical protein